MWLVSNTIILRLNFVFFSATYNIDEANRDRIGVCYHNRFKSVAEQCIRRLHQRHNWRQDSCLM